MIQVQTKPHKRIEHHAGTITMCVAGCDTITWEFELIRSINGEQKNSVLLKTAANEAQREIIVGTILANLKCDQIKWT